jgi:voltage-gated potassium channel
MEEPVHRQSLRHRVYVMLFPAAWPGRGLSPANKCVSALILVSIGLAILESEPSLFERYPFAFAVPEFVLTIVFALEYAARLWSSAEDPRFGTGLRGRLRYALSLAALLDLLAISPLFLSAVGSEAFLFRLLRLLRILRLAKLGRYTRATVEIIEAVRSRRYELVASLVCALVLLLISSTFLYLVECDAQPEAFGSIPRAMWWSIATLTTVGYGDVIPVTPLGRVFGGATAIIGIGLIAMPTGILAAAFSDALARRRASEVEVLEEN